MNSMKPLFVMVLLAAAAYGVYVSITRKPKETATAPGEAAPWAGPPNVEMPGTPSADARVGVTPAGYAVPYGSGTPGVGGTAASSPLSDAHSGGAPPYASNLTSAGPDATQYPSTGYPPPSDKTASPGTPLAGGLPGPANDPTARLPVPSGGDSKFAAFMESVQAKLHEDRLADALLDLSHWYDSTELSPDQARRVTELLDQLAGSVIYSTEHRLAEPYRVQSGERLEQIAQRYDVPWLLLARINGIRDPDHLQPGRELKVVRGPFSAVIDLGKHELTLLLKGHYAGRFPIGVGVDNPKLEGTYVVCNQAANPPYYGSDGVQVAGDDPRNPLGAYWLGLGKQIGENTMIGIHGTSDPANLHRTGGRGSICLGDRDIDDVRGILSLGSRVVVRR